MLNLAKLYLSKLCKLMINSVSQPNLFFVQFWPYTPLKVLYYKRGVSNKLE